MNDPFSPTLQRIAAASGLIFVVLIVLSIVVNPETLPDTDAAPQESSTTSAKRRTTSS